MKKTQQKMMMAGLAMLSGMLVGNNVQAGIANFDNGGGDSLFSNPINWVGDVLPVNNDRIDVRQETTAVNPALVDPAWNATPANCYFHDTSGSYITIQSNATFGFGNVYLGTAGGYSGTITVQNGGPLSRPGNTGKIFIGTSGGSGHLFTESGSALEIPDLEVGSGGVFEFLADSAGFASAAL